MPPALAHCILSFLLILLSGNSFAQQNITLPFESLSINDGLSQGFVSSIIQDRKGFMWFGTSDGLNKYDGYQFTVYHHDNQDSSSLSNDDITCLFEDSKQRLWVGTRHHGLEMFDREKLRFYHFIQSGKNSIRSNNILGITEDNNGGLWIRTDKGIDHLQIIPGNKKLQGDFISANKFQFTPINLIEDAPAPLINPVEVLVDKSM